MALVGEISALYHEIIGDLTKDKAYRTLFTSNEPFRRGTLQGVISRMYTYLALRHKDFVYSKSLISLHVYLGAEEMDTNIVDFSISDNHIDVTIYV